MLDPKEIPCPKTLGLKVLDPKRKKLGKTNSPKNVAQKIKVQ